MWGLPQPEANKGDIPGRRPLDRSPPRTDRTATFNNHAALGTPTHRGGRRLPGTPPASGRDACRLIGHVRPRPFGGGLGGVKARQACRRRGRARWKTWSRMITENPVALSTGGAAGQGVGVQATADRTRHARPARDHRRRDARMPPVGGAARCVGGLRYGEVVELRRRDLDLVEGIVQVRRAVTWSADGVRVGPPKTDAGVRDVHLPAFLVPLIEDHLARHAQPGPNGLLFPSRSGEHIWPATFWRVWRKAREAAGRPDLRFHDLRHTGAVMAAETDTTRAELMARLGHTSARMAIRYQHAALNADQRIAEELNLLATGGRCGSGPGRRGPSSRS
jgi:integrase